MSEIETTNLICITTDELATIVETMSDWRVNNLDEWSDMVADTNISKLHHFEGVASMGHFIAKAWNVENKLKEILDKARQVEAYGNGESTST